MFRALTAVMICTPMLAYAQCKSDLECKGDRVCVSGECRAPFGPPESSATASREMPGWALGGAILGFTSSGVVLALATGSAITNGNLAPAMTLGGAATILFGVTTPLVSTASGSVRDGANVPGVLGLRIAGWVGYGLTLSNAVAALLLGALDNTVPTPLIVSLGLLAATDEVLFSVEALVARSQASGVIEHRAAAERAPLRVAPIFTVLPSRDHAPGGVSLELAGSF